MKIFNILAKILNIRHNEETKIDFVFPLYHCKYNGYWCGIYKTENPIIGSAIGEFCSYQYETPSEIWDKACERYPGLKSIQIKYFISGVDDKDKIRTIIFECNRTNKKYWWTYCKNRMPLLLIREIANGERTTIKKVKILPSMKNGKIVYWLAETNGWNRHCKYLLGYDDYKIQEFVVRYV